jgi:hypothetical protein
MLQSAALCTSEIASSVDPGKTGDPDYWNLVMKGNAAAEDLTLMLGRGLTEDLAGVIKKRAELNCMTVPSLSILHFLLLFSSSNNSHTWEFLSDDHLASTQAIQTNYAPPVLTVLCA